MKVIKVTITSSRDDIRHYMKNILNELKNHDEIEGYIISEADGVDLEGLLRRKVGSWIDRGEVYDNPVYHSYECSGCGKSVYDTPWGIIDHHFCLHCGETKRGVE